MNDDADTDQDGPTRAAYFAGRDNDRWRKSRSCGAGYGREPATASTARLTPGSRLLGVAVVAREQRDDGGDDGEQVNESLGGRWVPSEYARDVFDGPGGRSKPEAAARSLAEQCPAVGRYRVFRTTAEEAHAAASAGRPAQATVEVDKSRSARDGTLIDTALARTQQRAVVARPASTNRGTPTNGTERS